jgi:cytochrome c oxidase cbb3-type subunit 3
MKKPGSNRRIRAGLVMLLAGAALAACNRENRNLNAPAAESGPRGVTVTQLFPGPASAQTPTDPRGLEYEGNSTHIANGQRYYRWFNCSGCHFNGGGGIGPALMDDKWRYGGSIEQIYTTIAEGRPNGMPAFRDKIPPQQIWEIAAFVRSLSGNVDPFAAPSRPDAMRSIPAISKIRPEPQEGDPGPSAAGPG